MRSAPAIPPTPSSRRPPAQPVAARRASPLAPPPFALRSLVQRGHPNIPPMTPLDWALLPLRLFLSVTFIYAGLQKLTDPQFFRPHAIGYIGRQLLSYANGSPLRGLLLTLAVPHAQLIGGLIAYGEIAIGLGALVGLLMRPAAAFGALLSLLFLLTVSWRVRPYFYGSDSVYLVSWLTLMLAGPRAGGWPVFDAPLLARLDAALPNVWRQRLIPALTLLLGVAPQTTPVPTPPAGQPRRSGANPQYRRAGGYGRPSTLPRRDFVFGAVSGGVGALILAWLWGVTHPTTTSSGAAGAATATPAASSTTPSANGVIAQISQTPTNSAVSFTIPSNGDPGLLVHLDDGSFVAFDATCTHAGCPVQYDPSAHLLVCPCHGAAFDPKQSAAAVQGPTNTPLTPVAISVDQAAGSVSLK